MFKEMNAIQKVGTICLIVLWDAVCIIPMLCHFLASIVIACETEDKLNKLNKAYKINIKCNNILGGLNNEFNEYSENARVYSAYRKAYYDELKRFEQRLITNKLFRFGCFCSGMNKEFLVSSYSNSLEKGIIEVERA